MNFFPVLLTIFVYKFSLLISKVKTWVFVVSCVFQWIHIVWNSKEMQCIPLIKLRLQFHPKGFLWFSII